VVQLHLLCLVSSARLTTCLTSESRLLRSTKYMRTAFARDEVVYTYIYTCIDVKVSAYRIVRDIVCEQ
jgi:hypothetical protein